MNADMINTKKGGIQGRTESPMLESEGGRSETRRAADGKEQNMENRVQAIMCSKSSIKKMVWKSHEG